MASKLELYDLIKSLDAKEKRYMKMLMKALSGSKEKKYQAHFDAIVSMKKFDKLLWKRKMGLSATTKQIKETNNYLYDFILKGLIIYTNAQDKSQNRILVEAQKINMLMKKGLYDTASKKIDELIQLSNDQQFFDLSLHLLNQKRSISFGTGKLANDEHFAEQIYDDFEHTVNQCNNINEYLRLLHRTKLLVDKHSTVRNAEIEATYHQLGRHPLLESGNLATNLRSKNLFFVIKLALCYLTFNEEEAFRVSDQSIDYFGNGNSKLYDELYFGFMMSKRLELCALFGRWEEFEKSLERFNSRLSHLKTFSQKQYWFMHNYRHVLIFLYAKTDLEQFKKTVEELNLDEYENSINAYAGVYFECEFNTARLYHLDGNYDMAIEKLNKVIDNHKFIGDDHLIAAKILLLIIHFELDHRQYLPYAIQSLYRSLLKMKGNFLAEKKLIHFLRKAIKLNNRTEFMILTKSLFKSWNSMKQEKFQRDFFFYFPYCEWILSKIENRPFYEVLKEQLPHPSFKPIQISVD